jgi:hypothetical protein
MHKISKFAMICGKKNQFSLLSTCPPKGQNLFILPACIPFLLCCHGFGAAEEIALVSTIVEVSVLPFEDGVEAEP